MNEFLLMLTPYCINLRSWMSSLSALVQFPVASSEGVNRPINRFTANFAADPEEFSASSKDLSSRIICTPHVGHQVVHLNDMHDHQCFIIANGQVHVYNCSWGTKKYIVKGICQPHLSSPLMQAYSIFITMTMARS